MPPVAISRINTSLYSSFQRAVVTGQRSNLVSSSGYRNRLLLYSTSFSSETSLFLPLHFQKRKTMSASGSKAFSGDVSVDGLISSCGNPVDFTKPSAVFFDERRHRNLQRASLRLKRPEPSNTLLFCRFSTYEAVRKNDNSLKPAASRSRSPHIVPFAQYSGGPIHGVSLEGNSHDGLIANSAAGAGQCEQAFNLVGPFLDISAVFRDSVGNRVLRLLSGSCCLPHPDKEAKGGEDAHFICEDEQVIGVADGVGGWADVGVDAGLFSRELMSNSVNAIKEESDGRINPARVLEKAHAGTKARGSSTACIIALTEEGLDAINLGDSGFIVIRDGSTVFRSPTQQHGFNFTYQLESGNTGDLPSSGEVFRIPVVPGDVIVAGTDGLFDNLYNNEITAVVVDAVRSGLGPQATAQKIAALARQRALDRKRQTPFATAAQEAGFRYHGGKLDDITVVVSFVTSTSSS